MNKLIQILYNHNFKFLIIKKYYFIFWVQKSPVIASTIDAFFGKAKIYKLFVDFCFAKIVNYFLILIV